MSKESRFAECDALKQQVPRFPPLIESGGLVTNIGGTLQENVLQYAHPSHPSTRSYVQRGTAREREERALFIPEEGDIFLPPVFRNDEWAQDRMRRQWVEAKGVLWATEREAQSWNDLVDSESVLDLSAVEVHSKHKRYAEFDWKIFMEIYCDDYHVDVVHAGLSSMVDCSNLEWIWAPWGQAQRVKTSKFKGGGSSWYRRFNTISEEVFGPVSTSAVWAAVYPGVMIEWLGGGVALSTLEPCGAGRVMNEVTFAYPKNLASAHPNFVQAHQGAYWETAQEDEAIGRSIQAGRHFLWSRNRDESGPVHPTLEAGIIKFHDWLMGAFKGAPE